MTAISKYNKLLILSVQRTLEYRVDFLMSILSGVFLVFVQVNLWTAMFKSTSATTIYGYTYGQMIIYVLFAAVIGKLLSPGIEQQISSDIKQGKLSKYLIQPINYGLGIFFQFLGKKIIQLSTVLLMLLTLFLVVKSTGLQVHGLQVNSQMFWLLLTFPLGILINFLIYFILSLLAFWLTEVFVFFFGVNVITSILSGVYFPLDVFGEKIVNFINYMPFKYTTYFNLNIALNIYTSQEIIQGLAIQITWVILLLIACTATWRMGLRRYVATGG